MKKLVVLNATASGSRLFGRALLPLGGKPLLVRMIERVRAARAHFDVVISTSRAPENDDLLLIAREAGIPIFRGRSSKLFVNLYEQSRLFGADAVASISSRSSLIDPFVIDEVFATFERTECDFASNLCPASFPDGMGISVMRADALGRARQSAEPVRGLHVENVRFFGTDLSRSVKLAIDTHEDYLHCRRIFDALYTEEHPVFSLRTMLDLIARERVAA